MDEQKKTRKKLNIIDWIVILLLIAVVVFLVIRGVGLYRAAKVLEEPKEQNENARLMPDDFEPNFRFTVLCKEVDNELASQITASEFRRLYSTYNLLDAYISEITQKPSVLLSVNNFGKELQTQSSTRSDLILTVDAQIDLANPDTVIDGNFNPLVSSQEVRLGKIYSIKTMAFELTGTVTGMEILYAGE